MGTPDQKRIQSTSSTAIVSGLCKSSNFNVDSPGGSWSYIGTDAITIPVESFTMNFGFMDQPTVMHEFGHALGLIHEHQSPFKGGFEWNKKEVREIVPILFCSGYIVLPVYSLHETITPIAYMNGSGFFMTRLINRHLTMHCSRENGEKQKMVVKLKAPLSHTVADRIGKATSTAF